MITADEFTKATGYSPQDDDLERVNCTNAGQTGHTMCGWSHRYNKPMFMLTSYQREQSREATKPRIEWSGKYQCYFTTSADETAIRMTNVLNTLRAYAILNESSNERLLRRHRKP